MLSFINVSLVRGGVLLRRLLLLLALQERKLDLIVFVRVPVGAGLLVRGKRTRREVVYNLG